MSKRIAILGAGDLGRTLTHHADTAGFDVVGYYDDLCVDATVLGRPVFGKLAAALKGGEWDALVMGIGYRHLSFRKELFESLIRGGLPFATLIHPSCYVDDTAEVEAGSVLFPNCTLDVGVRIGANCILNAGCVVAHDTTVGSHSFLGPGVALAGFVRTGECCFLGIGTVVIDNIELGSHTQTGGGAVVIDNFSGHGLLVGVPARAIQNTILP